MPTLKKFYRYDGSSWVEVLDFDTFAKTTQLSNYLPLSGGNLSGALVLNNGIYLRGKNTSGTAYNLIGVTSGNNVAINSSVLGNVIFYTTIRPNADFSGLIDIGGSSYLWRNLYLSGNLSDGTNSISIANIASQSWVENKGYLKQTVTTVYDNSTGTTIAYSTSVGGTSTTSLALTSSATDGCLLRIYVTGGAGASSYANFNSFVMEMRVSTNSSILVGQCSHAVVLSSARWQGFINCRLYQGSSGKTLQFTTYTLAIATTAPANVSSYVVKKIEMIV